MADGPEDRSTVALQLPPKKWYRMKNRNIICEAPTMTSTLSEPQMKNYVGTRTSTEKAPVTTCEEQGKRRVGAKSRQLSDHDAQTTVSEEAT